MISNLYGPESRGGAENIAKQAAQEMVYQGHDVTVLSTTARRVEGLVEGEQEGVKVLRFYPGLPYHILEDTHQPLWKRLLWHKMDLLPFGRAHGAVHEAIEVAKPDLIITHNLRGLGMSAVRAIQAQEIRWMHVLHDIQLLVPSGLYWLERSGVWQHPFVTTPYRWWLRWLIGSPDLVVGPTNYVLDAHRDVGFFAGSEVRVLQNPVAAPLEGEKGESSDTMQLLYLGQLAENKGVHVLIDALKQVDWPVELHVVGEGPEKTELEERSIGTTENVTVTFHGRVKHAQVFQFLRAADALIFPSVAIENCPGVILEANSVGTPVIGSDQGGVPELIDESGLFIPGSVESLVEALHRLKDGEVKGNSSKPQNLEQYTKHLLS